MFKPIKSFLRTFILLSFFLYVISFIFRNLFFIPSIMITISIILILGILFIIILVPHYQVKIDEKLKMKKNKGHSNTTYHFDELYKRLKLYYKLFFLVPLLIILYIEIIPKGIFTVADFENIKINPNGHYTLMKDLDLSSIKEESEYFAYCNKSYFDGVLDGNNKTLYNVNQTLFFCTNNKAVIKDLTLKNVSIKARYAKNTGVISNINYGVIDNVHVEGSVNGYDNTGGIVGKSDGGKILNSSFQGQLSGWRNVGGIIGGNNNWGDIINCFVKGNVSGKENVGGLVGYSDIGKLQTSFVVGVVSGDNFVGGIAGDSNLKIENVYSYANVYGYDYASGGIVASSANEINNSFTLGNVYGNRYAGGIGTSGWITIRNSFAYGDVISNEEQGSGFIYTFNQHNGYFEFENCFQYENQLVNGEALSTEDVVTKQQLLDINWYRDVLQLDETIWDLSPVLQGYFPQLKNIPNQENIPIE